MQVNFINETYGIQVRHKKKYELQEDMMRRANFAKTDAKIREHNSEKSHSWMMGHNLFSDWVSNEAVLIFNFNCHYVLRIKRKIQDGVAAQFFCLNRRIVKLKPF